MDEAPSSAPKDGVIHWTAGCFILGLVAVMLVVLVGAFVIWKYEQAG